jgi:murein DD-endopeptidase MepM/ murein hydrolase activator NlpD
MQYHARMKRALRFPLRWAGRSRTLLTAVAMCAGLGACNQVIYGAREGTMEYPGSGAAPGAVPTYVVNTKDTLDSVAQRYGVSRQTIIERNKLQEPYRIQPGQTLEIPGARVVEPSLPSEPQTASASAAPPRGPVKSEQLAPPPGSSQGESPNPAKPAAGEPTPLSPAASSVTVPATPPSGPAPRFEWPVRGRIVAPYGTQSGGQKNDGIDIATEKGAPVKAADGGSVVYAGSEVRGMGNLILVAHANGYITAYGYNDELLVKKGDTVRKGQVIAKAGTSGGAADPRVHFEVRHSGKTIDPAGVLPQ